MGCGGLIESSEKSRIFKNQECGATFWGLGASRGDLKGGVRVFWGDKNTNL